MQRVVDLIGIPAEEECVDVMVVMQEDEVLLSQNDKERVDPLDQLAHVEVEDPSRDIAAECRLALPIAHRAVQTGVIDMRDARRQHRYKRHRREQAHADVPQQHDGLQLEWLAVLHDPLRAKHQR